MILFMTSSVFAQKMMKKGVVKFEVTDISSDDPQASMMKGTTMDLYFTKEKQRVEINMMGGLVRVNTISNPAAKEEVVLSDMMGSKTMVKTPAADIDKRKEEMEKINKLVISYDKKDTKKIAGFDTYRANIKMESGDTIVAYITQQIQPENSYFNKMFKGLDGFPLEYIISVQGMKMTYAALEVSDAIDAKAFEIPEGYEEITMEEFQKRVGGMKF